MAAALLGVPAGYWLMAALMGAQTGAGMFLGHKKGMREVDLSRLMMEQQGKGTKISAIEARREQARTEKLLKQAMRLRERERMDTQMMQLMAMLESGRAERSDTLRMTLASMAQPARGGSRIPLGSMMRGGF